MKIVSKTPLEVYEIRVVHKKFNYTVSVSKTFGGTAYIAKCEEFSYGYGKTPESATKDLFKTNRI